MAGPGAGVRSQPGQPPEARQYSAAALAKGKMPAYTVLPSALLEERKVNLTSSVGKEIRECRGSKYSMLLVPHLIVGCGNALIWQSVSGSTLASRESSFEVTENA